MRPDRLTRHAPELETVWVEVPADAAGSYEAALRHACATVAFFLDEATGSWRIEGVKARGQDEPALATALLIAEAATGHAATVHREPTPAEGWLARTYASFPEQLIGRRFAVRGEHLEAPAPPGRITLTLDAGLAFGSGEHGSTRGCLRALEIVARDKPRRVLDLGTGSGILAMAAAKLLHVPVLGTDIEPWSVRVACQNARRNGVSRLVRPMLADGWRDRRVRAAAPYDLVFANILARPLCRMAPRLAVHLAPNGKVILSGLLHGQARMVLAAHRRAGLRLVFALREGAWTTLVCEKGLSPQSSPEAGEGDASVKAGSGRTRARR